MAEKKTKAAKPKKSPYGEDSKGRYRIIGGKKCYTKEEIEKELEKEIRKVRYRQ